jgi:hypothetical protein
MLLCKSIPTMGKKTVAPNTNLIKFGKVYFEVKKEIF